jgi:coatomer subunit beta'
MYLLGYIPSMNRLLLIDKALQVVSYTLHMSIINYQTAILRGDHKAASEILPKIPLEHRNRIAQFLDSQGFKEGR